MREVAAHGQAAAHEARCEYDSSRGLEPAVFVRSRVMGRLLTRYRQEWTFARRVAVWGVDASEKPAETRWAKPVSRTKNAMAESLREALDQLSSRDRWLVVQIFWHERDQHDLARELGVSQPAVSKQYRNIVRRLRCVFGCAVAPPCMVRSGGALAS